ncbi:MAG: hypothetical protein GXO35_04140 [Gammaproteobacteria bacterium]|nr:hypothetical protein [Gammaproteobacteria bacterium]
MDKVESLFLSFVINKAPMTPIQKVRDEKIICSFNFLLVSCVVESILPAAMFSFDPAIGVPHCGHDSAELDIWLLHSGQFIKAIIFSFVLFNIYW